MEFNIVDDDYCPLFHYQYRMILIGDSTVGKSSLLKYFTDGKTAEMSDPTIGVDFYARMIELKPDYRVKLQLWDTAGQEKFRSITRSYYRNSVGVMLVYDISNRTSFENIGIWLNEAEKGVGGPNPRKVVYLLVGHKSDDQSDRQVGFFFKVDYEEGEYFAKYHKMKFIETSAITGKNIFDAFLMMAQEISNRVEKGLLRPTDGWEGIKSGMTRSQTITLSEINVPYKGQMCIC
ncbi:Ras family protein [Dictyocaulus viviparus]|uniref:Ras family protein n=1 Tax=Dictyocaulus viviparus TaxID=29172 RepID=A0A0D8XEV5_DICVI|nr:Ras family protein [Dictyocaulus viviparus]